jgi:hypothetical protein
MVSVPLLEKERLVQDDAADPVLAPGHHNRTLNDQIMPASTQAVGKMTTAASVDRIIPPTGDGTWELERLAWRGS